MSTFAEYIATSHENALYAVKDLELNSSEYTWQQKLTIITCMYTVCELYYYCL